MTDRVHRRDETRTIQVLPAPAGMFPHAAAAFLIERHVRNLDASPRSAIAALGITSPDPQVPVFTSQPCAGSTVNGGGELVTVWHYGIEGRLPPMTVIHVRYEILDDPSRPHPDTVTDAYPWGVRAIGLPGNLSAHGVGDTLDSALADLSEAIRSALGDGPVPEELTREIAVTVEDAA